LQQEDYIKRQIDQLGRVLGKILADLIGLKAKGQVSEGIEAASEALKGELDLDIDDLASIPPEKFLLILKEEKKLSDINFEKLADILFLLAEKPDLFNSDKDRRSKLYERSLIMYEYLDKTSSTYSFERNAKIEKIRNWL
jgi:hypothetical protein